MNNSSIDCKNFTTKSVNGFASINLTDLSLGENNITLIIYNPLYICNKVEKSFNIEPKNTFLVLSDLYYLCPQR